MKILRMINAIFYIIAIVFGILDLAAGNQVFKIFWTTFLGIASLLLLVISIIQLRQRKKQRLNQEKDDYKKN